MSILRRSYRIVDYIDDNTFYVQFYDHTDEALSAPTEDDWEELTLCEPDTAPIIVVREVLVECEALGQRVTEAQELVERKQEAIVALLKAGDAAQAEIKRLQGLLDTGPRQCISQQQADALLKLASEYGNARVTWEPLYQAVQSLIKE